MRLNKILTLTAAVAIALSSNAFAADNASTTISATVLGTGVISGLSDVTYSSAIDPATLATPAQDAPDMTGVSIYNDAAHTTGGVRIDATSTNVDATGSYLVNAGDAAEKIHFTQKFTTCYDSAKGKSSGTQHTLTPTTNEAVHQTTISDADNAYTTSAACTSNPGVVKTQLLPTTTEVAGGTYSTTETYKIFAI